MESTRRRFLKLGGAAGMFTVAGGLGAGAAAVTATDSEWNDLWDSESPEEDALERELRDRYDPVWPLSGGWMQVDAGAFAGDYAERDARQVYDAVRQASEPGANYPGDCYVGVWQQQDTAVAVSVLDPAKGRERTVYPDDAALDELGTGIAWDAVSEYHERGEVQGLLGYDGQ